MQGKVGTFSVEKGYGFIFVTFKDRIFFHFSNWKSDTEPVIDSGVMWSS